MFVKENPDRKKKKKSPKNYGRPICQAAKNLLTKCSSQL